MRGRASTTDSGDGKRDQTRHADKDRRQHDDQKRQAPDRAREGGDSINGKLDPAATPQRSARRSRFEAARQIRPLRPGPPRTS